MAGLEALPQRRAQFGGDFVAHQVTIDLGGDIAGRGGMVEDQVDDLYAVEIAVRAQELLVAVVMLGGIDLEVEPSEIPTGKGACGFANIVFAVVADAHGEQFHDFAREVLVRRTLHVHASVEKGEHGRILGDAYQERAKIAEALILEQLELAQHLAIVAHLLFRTREMAVPEHRHLFLQRRR